MAAAPDFKALYDFQDQALALLSEADTGFYLTGGTAGSRGYLGHRYSEDLDLFVNDDSRFRLWADRIAERLSACNAWSTEVSLRDERFVRLFLVRPDLSLKIEMVNDVPSRIGEVTIHPVLGRLDTAENILANKISALIDREEPKDLADVWGFCTKLGLSIDRASARRCPGQGCRSLPGRCRASPPDCPTRRLGDDSVDRGAGAETLRGAAPPTRRTAAPAPEYRGVGLVSISAPPRVVDGRRGQRGLHDLGGQAIPGRERYAPSKRASFAGSRTRTPASSSMAAASSPRPLSL